MLLHPYLPLHIKFFDIGFRDPLLGVKVPSPMIGTKGVSTNKYSSLFGRVNLTSISVKSNPLNEISTDFTIPFVSDQVEP